MPETPTPASELVLYQTEDGSTRLEVRLENETVWLTQNQMAELFQTTKQNVSSHILNLFQDKELRETSVVRESFTTAADGKNYLTKFYNLDVIISVGYRVKSLRGTQFRIWAVRRPLPEPALERPAPTQRAPAGRGWRSRVPPCIPRRTLQRPRPEIQRHQHGQILSARIPRRHSTPRSDKIGAGSKCPKVGTFVLTYDWEHATVCA